MSQPLLPAMQIHGRVYDCFIETHTGADPHQSMQPTSDVRHAESQAAVTAQYQGCYLALNWLPPTCVSCEVGSTQTAALTLSLAGDQTGTSAGTATACPSGQSPLLKLYSKELVGVWIWPERGVSYQKLLLQLCLHTCHCDCMADDTQAGHRSKFIASEAFLADWGRL